MLNFYELLQIGWINAKMSDRCMKEQRREAEL